MKKFKEFLHWSALSKLPGWRMQLNIKSLRGVCTANDIKVFFLSQQLWMYCKCTCIIKKNWGGGFMGQGVEKWLLALNSCWYWLQTCNNVLVLTNVDWFYCRNPYDIPRKNLIDQIARMRSNFLQKSFHRTKLVDDGKYQVFDINWILIG